MKSHIGNAVLLGLAMATAAAVGCSSSPSTTSTAGNTGSTQPSGNNSEVGTVSMKLSLGETSITSVNYTLQNGAGVVQSGTVSTANSAGITFQLGQVPAGAGYSITLTAASADGGVSCLGTSAPFAVVAHSTVVEQTQMTCTFGADDNGNIELHGTAAFCGTWQSVSTVGPGMSAATTNGSEVNADGVTPVVISATANGADTAALAYTWSVLSSTGGGVTLGPSAGNGTTSDTISVTCNQSTQSGSAVVQLVVTDSQDGGAVTCPSALSTTTVNVFCDAVAQITCTAPDSKCGTGSTAFCANLNTDNNNCGTCGTICQNGETCQAGVCACPSGTTLCGTACVNEQTDKANCGACGHACTGTQTCNAGVCGAAQCAATDFQCQCNQFVATNEPGAAPADTCTATELAAFKVDAQTANAGSCLDCLLVAGQCLDNLALGTSDVDCEDPFTGPGAGETTQECVNVLNCDLGVAPPALPGPVTATGPGPNQAFCGTTPIPACQSGTTPPNGACITEITAGFPTNFSVGTITGNIAVEAFASGRAGAIVGCAQNSCTQCLTGSAN